MRGSFRRRYEKMQRAKVRRPYSFRRIYEKMQRDKVRS